MHIDRRALVFACLLAGLPGAVAQTPQVSPSQELLDSLGQGGDDFGASVSIDGDMCVVGAPGDDDGGSGSGSAVVYRWKGNSFKPVKKLKSPTPNFGYAFGRSVAVQGSTVAIGSDGNFALGAQSGSVFLYEWDGLSLQPNGQIDPDDGQNQDDFGYSLALDGDVLVVGARGVDDNHGAAYVFRRTNGTWTQEQKLLPPATFPEQFFGWSVDVDGDVIVVGGPTMSGDVLSEARVYRWNGTSWGLEQVLSGEGQFGGAVAVEDGVIAVGAARDIQDFYMQGSVSTFSYDGAQWQPQQKLYESDPGQYFSFGTSLALDHGALLIGADRAPDDQFGFGPGLAWLYRWSGDAWFEDRLLSSPPASNDARFGSAVALSGAWALVGAPDDDGTASSSGAAPVLATGAGPWTWLGHALDGLQGPPFLAGYGNPTPGAAVSLRVGQSLPSALLHLVIGLSALEAPFKGGVLVPAPDVVLGIGLADLQGDATLTAPWPAGLPSGLDVLFQVWIADATGPANFAATNGLQATTP